jgi:sialic acid synthase SpsE/spore coat polysaccharide biosynthesis protein SpsF (cytidylyltransferase family)
MIVAVIPAKAESTRLADKNMQTVNGEALVVHAIRYARTSSRIAGIYVSTDSDEIAACAAAQGVRVIRRGPELGGEAPLMEVYRHAWQAAGADRVTHIVGIQPDHPDRQLTLDEALDYALGKGIDDLFTVDRNGVRNGSLRILNSKALSVEPAIYASALRDDCVNIHTAFDLGMARRHLSAAARTIEVAGQRLGEGEPTFIIAEAACNHMCRLDLARRMIDLAAEAGANAVKFQTYKAERLVRAEATTYWAGAKISQLEYYRNLDRFDAPEYAELFAYAAQKGIIGFSTPFDVASASMLHDLGMPLFKVASCDLPDKRLLRHVAGFQKPMILSVGGSTPEEIDAAIETVFDAGNFQLILLACTLSYPTKNEDANLRRIAAMQERYPGMIIGLSDHTEPDSNMVIPAIGVALGAKVIEKHYTLDRSLTGSGHFFSVNPDDLAKMVANIRLAETVLGRGEMGVLKAEEAARDNARRSIVADVAIPQGQMIASAMLGMKRPADGLPATMIDLVVGRKARRDINADETIQWDMLEP